MYWVDVAEAVGVGGGGVKRESGKRRGSPVFGIARREFAKIY
jgi:hypothetical protein